MASQQSPDLSPYLDLRVYDKDPQEIYEAAMMDLKSKEPGWVPREDQMEVMLMESLALEVSESVFAINRLPGSIFVILANLYGITRDEGAPPTSTVRVTVVDTFGYTIPADTRFLLSLAGGLDPIVFSTTTAVLIPNGSDYADIPVVGNRNTSQANGIAAGVTLEILDAVAFIESAVLHADVVNGRGAETDQSWATRVVQRLQRLTSTLAVPQHFTTAALEEAVVERATTIDLYDPSSGNDPGEDPGHVTIAVYGQDRMLTTDEKNAIETDFESRTLANLSVHVVDPTITTVNITVTVHRFSTYTDQQTTDMITAALGQYLSPATWPWKGIVRRNELIQLISNVAAVDYVDSIAVPASDFALSGVAPLADLGTLNVTVVAP